MIGSKFHTLKDKFIYGFIVTVIFLVLLGGSVLAARQEKTVYQVVCFGDSVIGRIRGETSITAILEERLGTPVFNGAFGGTGISRWNQERRLAYTHDGFSMAALAKAAAYDDFGMQQTIRITDNGTDYFEETIDTLSKIDYSQVKVVFIQQGTNDYNRGVPIYNEADPYDPYSFTGALRGIIRDFRTKLPHIRIILVTPTYCWFTSTNETCEEWNEGYGYLADYVAAEIAVAKELGVEVIDNYDLFPHDTWEDWLTYTDDGLHANTEGRKLIADTLADYLEENP